MGYQDEVLAIRQQRAQRDIAEAQEVIRGAVPESRRRERDQAAAMVMPRHYDAWDRECEQA